MENMEPRRTRLKKICDEKCWTDYYIVIKYGREDSVYLGFVFILYLFIFTDFLSFFLSFLLYLFIYLFTCYQFFYHVLTFDFLC